MGLGVRDRLEREPDGLDHPTDERVVVRGDARLSPAATAGNRSGRSCPLVEHRDAGLAALMIVTRQFHIEDRALSRIVATGEIDDNGLVVWDETDDNVSGEGSAARIGDI